MRCTRTVRYENKLLSRRKTNKKLNRFSGSGRDKSALVYRFSGSCGNERDETVDSAQTGIATIVVKNAFSGLNQDHLRRRKLLQKPLAYSHIHNRIRYRENVIPHH